MKYDFKKIEAKWQKKWEKEKVFEVRENSKKKKYYVLEMFPYPSGGGLHMGHAFNYTIGDVYARFKRMNGFNVLYPMGYDSFGLPAENAAIQAKKHPKTFTEDSIKNFVRQQKSLGLSYDWSRMLKTSDPEYYKWNQYFFLKFLEKGLAYRKKAPVNWCSKCDTVLANEQVHNGKCWRHADTEVEVKNLEQWFLRITDYANEILGLVDSLGWPEKVKIMQKNWIGKSHGTEIDFEINEKKWSVFTTRPDTLYGVTFMVVSAQHQNLMILVVKEKKKDVEKFLKKIKTTKQEDLDKLDKEGVFTGSYAIHPLTKEKIPVWVGNFVLAEYGSGMVMGVPAHDQRDFEFAKKYNLPIKEVIKGGNIKKESYLGEGKLINSAKFNDLINREAKEHITLFLKNKSLGKKTTQYKLRDWLISRQRYWGTPIPVIYCDFCGIVPVNEKDLPIKLPEKVKFGKGNPLETNKKFLETKCPKCNGKGRRETDTMDTFFDSAWYFLRYCDNKNNKKPFDKKKVEYWMSVDQYIGGVEHATMHLIYARFFVKVLRDLKFFKGSIKEPFSKLFNQGMLHGEDGNKMSKSLGNVIDPLSNIKKYGADSMRLFLVSVASSDSDFNWNDKGIQGSYRFLRKVDNYFKNVKVGKSSKKVESKLNKTIKAVTNYIENFKYNLAIIKIRSLFDSLSERESKETLENFLKLLHLFCPHITEELWGKIGNKRFISLEKWPKVNEKKIKPELEKQEQAIEKLVSDINNILRIIKEKENKEMKKGFIYVLPNEKDLFESEKELIQKRTNLNIEIFSVSDKKKHDLENKSKKVKPGKPGIYLE